MMNSALRSTRSVWLILLFLGTGSVAIAGLLSSYSTTRVGFVSGVNELRGTLILPDSKQGPFPVVIFVQGDGALPHDAYGYYNSIWNALAERGIASFSWDKPGVGDSDGNWLSQNMDDRAAEVVAAYQFLQQQNNVDASRTGVIGFSQAGWVLPRLADEPWVDYMVFVSTAVNWVEQSDYLTHQRLIATVQENSLEMQSALAQQRTVTNLLLDELADYDDYLALAKSIGGGDDGGEKPMGQARFSFVKKNVTEDATQRLAAINVPVLALFGVDDLNIDVENSVAVYDRVFQGNKKVDFKYHVFPAATHALSKTRYFNKTNPGLLDVIKINFLGDDLFADGVLDSITEFAVRGSQVTGDLPGAAD